MALVASSGMRPITENKASGDRTCHCLVKSCKVSIGSDDTSTLAHLAGMRRLPGNLTAPCVMLLNELAASPFQVCRFSFFLLGDVSLVHAFKTLDNTPVADGARPEAGAGAGVGADMAGHN